MCSPSAPVPGVARPAEGRQAGGGRHDLPGCRLDSAARGVFPPAEGGTTVVQQPSHRDAGVPSFTAHSVVFTDEDAEWVRKERCARPTTRADRDHGEDLEW
jgi:hypothetical protein